MITKDQLKQIQASQYACNFAGLVQFWAKIQQQIADECPNGTNERNRHHINRLFLEQAKHLIGDDCVSYSEAYAWLENETAKHETV